MTLLRVKINRQKHWHDITVLLSFLVIVVFVGILLKDHLFASIQFALDPKPQQEISYQVETGDTLWSVSGRMLEPGEDIRNKVIEIRKLNGLQPTQSLTPGQVVRIPMKRIDDSDFRYALKGRP